MSEAFYANVEFWQGAAAFIAIILSQCPPVWLWFKRARLVVEPYDRVALTDEIGLPTVQWQLSITNMGGRDVRVKKVTLTLRREKDERAFSGRGYFEKSSDLQAVLLTPFSLKVQEVWSYNVSFFPPMSWEDRQTFAKLRKTLRDDILEKRAGLPKDHPDIAADQQHVEALMKLFEKNFYWRAGEYEAILCVETDVAKANTSSRFRFTLFESESDAMRARSEQFKFGYGVITPNPDGAFHFADVYSKLESET